MLPLTNAQWRGVLRGLAGQALFRAKLLAGEMPHEIEDVFAEAGMPLFPRLAATWTCLRCPDWGVPCKHLAAVCYVLAEEFDATRSPCWPGAEAPRRAAGRAAPAPGAARGRPAPAAPRPAVPPLTCRPGR